MTKKELRTYALRFKQLIRVLKALTPHQRKKRFIMSDWTKETPCGTARCAAGYAAVDPWFIRRGFQLAFDSQAVEGPRFDQVDQWGAIRAFFGELPLDGFDVGREHVQHPVFAAPDTVTEVIRAAEKRIQILELLAS